MSKLHRRRQTRKAVRQLKRLIWAVRYRFFLDEERLQQIREKILLVLVDELKILQDRYELGEY
ncbi:MAG: hypothetical protein NC131_15720 [Roseburia sp.]|nr:hypothetical protein [Roseburia sp.]